MDSTLFVPKTRSTARKHVSVQGARKHECSDSFKSDRLNQIMDLNSQFEEEEELDLESTDEWDITNGSRIRFLAQVKGFRSYHRLIACIPIIRSLCSRIMTLSRRKYSSFPLMMQQVDRALLDLAQCEKTFFAEADKSKIFEQKTAELEHIKANVEKCIKNSIASVKSELYHKTKEYISDPENSQKQYDTINRETWRSQIDYQVLVSELKEYMVQVQHECNERNELLSTQEIESQLKEISDYCDEIMYTPSLQLWLESTDCLMRLHHSKIRLQILEQKLMRSLLQYQSATNLLLHIVQEAKCTTNMLKRKTQELQNNCDPRALLKVVEEEQVLMSFIDIAKSEQKMAVDNMEDNPYIQECRRVIEEEEQRRNASFRSKLHRTDKCGKNAIWALSWNPKTKLLKSKALHQISE